MIITTKSSNSGMGELHLEIILDRIRRDFKIDAELGAVQVVYKERLNRTSEPIIERFTFDRVMNGKRCQAEVELELNGEFDSGSDGSLVDAEGKFQLKTDQFWASPDRPDLPPFLLEKLVSRGRGEVPGTDIFSCRNRG